MVFPEFAHAAPVYTTAEALHEKLAVPVPNEWTDLYAKKARQHGCFVQTGSFLEKDATVARARVQHDVPRRAGGVLAKYRKVNPWIPWEVHTSPHDLPGYGEPLFPVTKTEIGAMGVAICSMYGRRHLLKKKDYAPHKPDWEGELSW